MLGRRPNRECHGIDRARLPAIVPVFKGAALTALQPVGLWRATRAEGALSTTLVIGPAGAPGPERLLASDTLR